MVVSEPGGRAVPRARRKAPALGAVIGLALTGFAGVASAFALEAADAYAANCAKCHGADLSGATAPPLAGFVFVDNWYGKKDKFIDYSSKAMPPDAPGSLPHDSYVAIANYVFGFNKLDTPAPPRSASAAGHEARNLPGPAHIIASASTSVPDAEELRHPDRRDWLFYNLTAEGTRHSELRQLDTTNVRHLAPRCIFQTGEIGSFQASPIERKGRLYFTTARRTYAIDAANCGLLWQHEYPAGGQGFLPNNRGVALYRGMVIRGTLDGHLIALDAENGALLWDIPVCDSATGCFISAAPVVFDNKIIVGEAGADFGAVDHVHAFDADTLKLLWTFRTTPLAGQMGGSTWSKDSDRRGAPVWSTITADAAGHLYVSLGNPGPDFDGRARPGADLFTDSVVVLDAASGKLLWYVQQVPHDTHDWDTGAAPVLYDVDGRPLLAVGSKDGHVYLYDRTTHRELARAEVSTQLNVDKELSATVATRFCPGTLGGVEWNGPALDPVDQMLFVNAVDWCATATLLNEPNAAIPWGAMATQDPVKDARGTLTAIDALTGKEKWRYGADAPMLAAVTTTATGLVLTGTGRGLFLAFDARSGKELYRFSTGGAMAGGVSTYEVDSRQYVAVLSGNASKTIWQNTGAATVIVFGLPEE